MSLPVFRTQLPPGESGTLPVLRSAVLTQPDAIPDLPQPDTVPDLPQTDAVPGLPPARPIRLAGLRRLAGHGRHRARERQRAGSRAGAGPLPQPPVLCLACSFTPGNGSATGDAALARVLAGDPLAGTVVLALSAAAELDAEACAALRTLADELEAAGIALRLAVTCHQHRQQLAVTGLTSRLGPGAIYPTPRAAVLAVHASRPGPGLVTPEIREALLIPPEQLPPA